MDLTVSPARAAARLPLILCALALVITGVTRDGVISSSALLTSSRTTTGSTVATGRVALALSGGASAGTWTGSFSLVPGAASTYQRITVTNSESVQLRYAVIATSTTDTLASLLAINVAALTPASTACTAANYSSGVVVSAAPAAGMAGLVFGSVAGQPVIGDMASGSQAGDRVLPAAGVDNLCMRIDFPVGTGLGYAGRGATAISTFSFVAENAQ